jgi:hypothetical protein
MREHAMRASNGLSTHQRSFLEHYEAMPTNRRFPLAWSIEDNGAFLVKDA